MHSEEVRSCVHILQRSNVAGKMQVCNKTMYNGAYKLISTIIISCLWYEAIYITYIYVYTLFFVKAIAIYV